MSPERADEERDAYVRDLEQAVRRLEQTNRQLASGHLGIADSAAAAALDRIRNRTEHASAPPGPGRRAASRLKRIVTLILPHGIVLLYQRLRDREHADD